MKTTLTRFAPLVVPAGAALRRSLQSLLCGLALTMAFATAHAAGPPEAMTYQGFLVDANGAILAPNTPANYPVIFRIFASPTGGTSLWSEQQIVTVDKGNFSVILSEGTAVGGEPRGPLSSVLSTNGADRYIQLSVSIGATPTDMLPRLRLLPSPYSFLATSANNLVSPSGVPVIKYANNRAEVTGDLYFSGGLSGNGSGLTGLSTDQLGTGTLADTRLSANVALRNANNQFSANQTINGTLGLGTAGGAFPITVGNNTLGDKISLWGQSLTSFGFGVQPGLLQIHSDSAGSDIAFGYGSSAAMGEVMRIKGNGNVGVGTLQPSARLSLVGPGAAEIGGNARSATLLTSAGSVGTTANNELALASFGFGSGNSSSLGVRALRAANGTDWTSTAVGLGMDVDNSVRAGASLWLHANGNVGIGTTTPGAKLEVNGAIKATSMTVNGLTVNGPVNATTFNGEQAPVTYVVGPGSNLNSWREQQIDGSSLLADDNGGTIRVLLRHHGSKEVRNVSFEFYMENDANNFAQATRFGSTRSTYGGEWNYRLGSGTTNDRYDVANFADWLWIRNYRSGAAFGGVDAPAENAANRYKFWVLLPPNVTATVILYDR